MQKPKKKKVKKKIKNPIVTESALLYNKLTSIKFKQGDKVYEIDLGSELLVDSLDGELHSQVERIPAVLGYFGSIVAHFETEYKNKKVLQRKIEARIDRKIRESGVNGEARIEKAVRRHPKWAEACFEVNKASEKITKARFFLDALREKSKIMISRSADLRSNPSDSILGVKREDVISM